MIFNYKLIIENINAYIFIIFAFINLSNIIYYFYFRNTKKKVKFNELNLIKNNIILNYIKSIKNNEIIVNEQHIIYDIKNVDSDDDFYGHFCDPDPSLSN